MTKIYLDTNIFVSFYSPSADNKQQKEAVISAFTVFEQLGDVELWTSMWTITEMVKVLIRKIKMDAALVSEIEKELINECRLLKLKIHFADVSPVPDYDFKEFFYHIRKGILSYDSGVGDVMHSIIMKNNAITHILTFDGKDDFKKIPELTVLNPYAIQLPSK